MKKLLKYKIDTRPFFLSMNKQKIFKKMKLFSKICTKYFNDSSNGLFHNDISSCKTNSRCFSDQYVA